MQFPFSPHRDHIACLNDLRLGQGNPLVYVHEWRPLMDVPIKKVLV